LVILGVTRSWFFFFFLEALRTEITQIHSHYAFTHLYNNLQTTFATTRYYRFSSKVSKATWKSAILDISKP
jgi:hypothetical protein